MSFDIVTIFPAMIEAPLAAGVLGRAIAAGLIDVKVHDLRDFTSDRHRVVDDVPYGGGPGMVLKAEPVFRALDADRGGAGRRTDGHPDVAAGNAVYAGGGRAPEPRGAAGVPVRPLRGVRRARASAGQRGVVDRRLRAHRRRIAGARDDRRCRPARSGRSRRRAVGRRRFVRARAARLSALHSSGRARRRGDAAGAGGAAVGAPRRNTAVAEAGGARTDAGASPELLETAALDDEEQRILEELRDCTFKETTNGRD